MITWDMTKGEAKGRVNVVVGIQWQWRKLHHDGRQCPFGSADDGTSRKKY